MAVIRRNCPHCPTQEVAFELSWAELYPGYNDTWNCAALCGACRKPICFMGVDTAGRNASPTLMPGAIEPRFRIIGLWPSRAISAAPPHTPDSVKRRFIEGEEAYSRKSWNASVAMYRSALDIATKCLEDVPKDTFFNRLQWLHKNGRITADMKAWGDHVRIEGNAALHDPDDFDEEDAKPLRLFTEMFLRYVFELPGEVRAFRGVSG